MSVDVAVQTMFEEMRMSVDGSAFVLASSTDVVEHRPSNLQWCTFAENEYSFKQALLPSQSHASRRANENVSMHAWMHT